MEHNQLVIDTGVFIEFLRRKDKIQTFLYQVSNKHLFVSAVTLYELYMGATTLSKEQDVRLLTEDLSMLPFDTAVAKKSADIYQR